MSCLLKVEGITKYYGKKAALCDLSFSITTPSIVGLVGENGAGKSTLLNIISGKLFANQGTINVSGYDTVKDELFTKLNIGFMPDIAPLYNELSVFEYLTYCIKLKRVKSNLFKAHFNDLVEKLSLGEYLHYKCRNLSHGLKQRLSLAQALIGNPDILLLDEPTNGLDPSQIKEFCNLISEFSNKKIVLFSTHNLPIANEICSRALILKSGSLISDTELNSSNNSLCYKVRLFSENINCEKLNTIKSLDKLVDFKSSNNQIEFLALTNDEFNFTRELNTLCFASNSIIQELIEQKKPIEEIYFKSMLGGKDD